MMNTAIAFNEHSPSARIGLKRTELVQVERVSNLACYWMSVRHCLPPYRILASVPTSPSVYESWQQTQHSRWFLTCLDFCCRREVWKIHVAVKPASRRFDRLTVVRQQTKVQVDEMATMRSSGLPQRNARNGIPKPCGVSRYLLCLSSKDIRHDSQNPKRR